MNKNNIGQQLNQEQHISLLPQQLQAIRLISMSNTELEEEIQKALQDNPALEESSSEKENISEDNDDWELGEYASDDDIPEYKLRQIADRNQKREDIPFAATAPNLIDSITNQIDMMRLSDRQREITIYVLGNMSDDGYIRRSVEELEDDILIHNFMQVDTEEIKKAISIIQSCEPRGVGAKDLQECLLIQLRSIVKSDEITNIAIDIIENNYDAFATKNFEKLKSSLGIDDDTLDKAYNLISHLNPKPGASIGDQAVERLMHYNPDFIVTVDQEDNLHLTIVGEREIAPLRLSADYINMAEKDLSKSNSSKSQKDAQQFIRHKIDQAKWFIDAMSQRKRTLRLTMHAIMSRQHNFFLSGQMRDLNPMVLRELAEDTGLDISTISRVTSSKSVQTDYGVFPLKSLFSESITNSEGQEVSNKEVKAILVDIIDKEDSTAPLSDNSIMEMLAERGYEISRRTVAKYRDELNIPTARLRKTIK